MGMNKFKLKYQIAFLVGVSVVLMILVQLFYYYRFYTLTRERAINYESTIINQTTIKINSIFKDVESAANVIAYNKHIQDFIYSDNHVERSLILEPFASDVLGDVKSLNPNIYSVWITDNKGRITATFLDYNSDIHTRLQNKYNYNEDSFKSPTFTNVFKDNSTGRFFFFYISPIVDTNGRIDLFKKIGVCTVMIDTSTIQELIATMDLTPNALFIVLDGENRVVASNNKMEQGELFYDITLGSQMGSEDSKTVMYKNNKVILQQKDLGMAGWKIVSVLPMSELTSDMQSMKSFGIMTGIILLVILVSIGYLFMRNITDPVIGLVKDMKKIGVSNIGFRLRVQSTNEVGILAMDINKMLDQIEDMTRRIFNSQTRLYEMELSKKQAEFSALQSQINPHFLYNTLNCISGMGLANGITEIACISSSMSNIFRYSIRKDELVFIREEVACIREYLYIVGLRYGNRYSLKIDVPDSIMDFKTLKMIFQPVVENALYHGLEKMEEGGRLSIKGFRNEAGDICFEVKDNGAGIEEARLEEIRNRLDSFSHCTENGDSRGVGIVNIQRRIRLTFGEKYGLFIYSKLNEGTKVVILMPAF